VQIFVFIATLLAGRVIYSVPMLYISGALAIFVLGGLTGVMIALVPFDWQAHDSYFIVAHLHYTLFGGMLFPVIGGFYYFFPLVNGKPLSPRLGRIAFWLLFSGFNIAFLPMHLTGLLGMPRRVYTYTEGAGFDTLNMISTIGAFILAAGFLVFVWDVIRPKGKQPYSERNPWNAGTLEWLAEMPDKPWGTRSIPLVKSRYPLWDQPDFMRDVDAGRFYLPDAEEGKRETLVTSTIDAEPVQCLRVAGPTFKTMLAALFTGGVFIFSTYHWWWPALISGVLALGMILNWLWTGTALIPEKTHKEVGLGVTLPLYKSGPDSVGWWAMFITKIGDMTAFFSLVFGYFFFLTVHDDFPPEFLPELGVGWSLLATLLLGASWLLTWLARRWNRADNGAAFLTAMIVAVLLALAGSAAWITGPWLAGLDPTVHTYAATVWVFVVWICVHIAAGVVMQLYCIARRLAGRLTAEHDIDICNVTLYWHFMAITVVISCAVLALFPQVI
jgi:cytochrome c oxidase subunit I+III